MAREEGDAVYLATIDRLEPEIAPIDSAAGWASIAVSLKRIADSLERLSTGDGLSDLIGELQPLIPKDLG
jgi:hypothetical protein